MKRFAAITAILMIVAGVALPGAASADVNDFVVTNFTADYYLTRADAQGQMRIVEQIAVDFHDYNHGILRAIPTSYRGHSLHLKLDKVSSTSGAPAQYSTSGSNGNLVLKIGDPNRTVTGNQEYTIDYTVDNVITFYGDHDELYWDINGDQWSQPFTAVQATVHLPSGLQLSGQRPVCYAGGYGSTSQRCSISATIPGVTSAQASNLGIGETLTVVLGFQKGYFKPMGFADYVRDYWVQAAELLVPIVVLGGAGFIWWFKRGRDAKGRGVIIPEYDAPDNMSPLEVDGIMRFTVQTKALTAVIISLAIRKYIRIIEQDNKKVLSLKKKTYSLQLLKKDWTQLSGWEQEIMFALFNRVEEGSKVDLAALATKLSSTANNVKKSVMAGLTSRGYFVSNPTKYASLGLLPAVALVWIFVPGALWLRIGCIAGAVIAAAFYHMSSARTVLGVQAKEHILGLKLYLEVAEKERIKKLQSPDAPYMQSQPAPAKTVELFEKLLPYAMVLGVEEAWAKQFASIYTTPPDWYAGHYQAFTVGYLMGSLNTGFAQSVQTSFASPSSSSGSGFGGGGFAGGGGGGGGGGGW
ncbi:MAG TPA: DUF2207 domain-containing protein [Candidatus Saccharimonadales bacterium]|nr:DUF2207 domain-containing protein [Candidatus Saccharimonadales bacterium]